MKKFLVYCFIAITSIFSSCGVTDTEENLQPGRRDYVWSVDTITVPKITFHSIWGESPNNVFIVAPGYGTYAEKLYNYKGEKWDMLRITNIDWNPNCLIGYSDKSIFIGDYKGVIYHYDGHTVSESYLFVDSNYTIDRHIQMMCAGKNSELYAIWYARNPHNNNYLNVILKYDGVNWIEYFAKVSEYVFTSIKYNNGKLYLVGQNYADQPKYVFELVDNKLQIIKKIIEIGIFVDISVINGKLYALSNGSLEKFDGKAFIQVLSFDNYLAYYAFGRNENDIFLTGYNGIYHYDGNDIKVLYKLPFYEFVLMNDPLIFENEIFVYGQSLANWGQNIIIHGKI